MRHRRSGGCLYTVVFIFALAAAALILFFMLNSVKSSGGGTMLTELMTKVGLGDKNKDSADGDDLPPDSGDGKSGLNDLPSYEAIRIEITQEKLRELLEEAMEDSFPLTLDEIIISSGGTVTINGSAQRDNFITMLEEQGSALSTIQGLVLKMAPEQMDFEAVLGVSYDASGGGVQIEPQKFTVYNLDIPVAMIPDSLTNKVNTSLTDFFTSYGRTLAGITLYDGYMRIYFE